MRTLVVAHRREGEGVVGCMVYYKYQSFEANSSLYYNQIVKGLGGHVLPCVFGCYNK